MRNPLRFFQEVKQEAFKVTWPTKKDTVTGSLMVFVLASLAAVFFLLLDQILKFFLDLIFLNYLNHPFLLEDIIFSFSAFVLLLAFLKAKLASVTVTIDIKKRPEIPIICSL